MKKILEHIRAMNRIGRVKVRIRANKNKTHSIFLDYWDGRRHHYGFRVKISSEGNRTDWERFKILKRKWEQADKEALERGAGFIPKTELTLQQLSRHYLNDKPLSDHTVAQYHRALRTPLEYLGDKLIGDLKPQQVEALPWGRYNPSTLYTYLEVLRRIFNYAVKKGWLEKTPVRMRPERPPTKRVKVFLTLDQIKRLAQTEMYGTGQTAKEGFLFAFNTGMRFLDVQKLTDRNIRDGYVYYRISKSGKKAPRDTRKYLNKYARRLVEGKKGSLFPIRRTITNSYLKEWVKRAGGMPEFTFHTAKRSLSQWLLEENIDPFIRSVLLDHKLPGIGPVYLNPYTRKADEALRMLEG